MNRRLLLITGSIIMCLIVSFQFHHTFNKAQETFSDMTFKYGATGKDVLELQGRLKFLGFYAGKIDGDYGWKTLQSVKHFQWKFGMPADGIVGSKTKLKLWEATKKWSPELTMDKPAANPKQTTEQAKKPDGSGMSTSNSLGLTANDLKIMANAVHGEARGEPYIGQVAVAAVILNRVDSPSFPKTVSGVIFQPGAFTAVADGQIWLEPDESSKRAVRDALNGWDPTNECIYYFNPETATSKWIWTRTQVKKIGKHIFAI